MAKFLSQALTHIATLGPVGFLPKAPGTWGSAAAVALAPLVLLPLPGWGRLLLILGVFFLGWLACEAADRSLGRHDPGCVIIDEVFGQWIALTPLMRPTIVEHAPWWGLLLGFVLFRLFDIIKPWPIRQVDRKMRGGLGVMLDDGLAGAAAGLILWGVMYLWGDWFWLTL